MPLAEPMTVATDLALALLGLWLGWRLRAGAGPGTARRWWAAAFWAMAMAALLGAVSHGLGPGLGEPAAGILWRSTMLAIGAAAVLLLGAVVARLGGGRAWAWALGGEWLVYAWWVWRVDSDFRVAVVQYGTAMLVVLAVHLELARRRRPGALSIVAGIAVSFLAAGIQQAGLAPHPNFNHNDLYHVVQMIGLLLLFRGAALAEPAAEPKRGT